MNHNIIRLAREVFEIEAAAISGLIGQLNADFEKSVEAIMKCRGKVVVSGMGKSGIIGKKISATLASTGTPSFFLHPAEAYHGDLGMITRDDILLCLSKSGETDEMLKIIPFFKKNGNMIISLTANKNSTLGRNSDFHLDVDVEKEACPLQLAPTASTTATLAMGDALAIALMEARKFNAEDFADFHPGGSLGMKLLTRVENLMFKDNLPIVTIDDTVKDVIHVMTSGRLGLAVVLTDSRITGVITDGDLRRAMESKSDFLSLKAGDIMTAKPKTISKDAKLSEAEKMLVSNKITSLLVEENSKLIGIIQIYSIPK